MNNICKICDEICKSETSLKYHLKLKHLMSYQTYYLLYIRKPNEKCFCEVCGNLTSLNKNTFKRFCSKSCANKVTTSLRHKNEPIFNKNKHEQTNLKNHGSIYYTNRDKYKETCKNKWDVNNYFKSKEYLIPRIFRDKQKFINKINKELKFGYTMNYNARTNKIHYHCNLCNNDYMWNRKSFMTRLYRKQNPCPHCYNKINGYSLYELEIRKYIKSFYKGPCLYNDRKIIHKEIDIYLPDLNLGIEFDGKYWHMDSRLYKPTDYNKNKQMTAEEIWKKDKLKDILAENKGIKLLHIKELDWIKSKDNEKIKIKNFIDTKK